MKQRIFLTTLNETRHRLDLKYYYHADEAGNVACTTGISGAEAGIRLALSSHPVDRILVTGPAFCAEDSETGKMVPLAGLHDTASDIRKMSEYAFLCYRLRQFLDGLDMEFSDIRDKLDMEARTRVRELTEQFRVRNAADVPEEDLFRKLCLDRNLDDSFEREVLSSLSPEESAWARQYLYWQMKDTGRMEVIPENRNVLIGFVPVETGGVLSAESMTAIAGQLSAGGDDIDLYLDAQGMSVTDGSVLISTVMLMNRRTGFQCSLRGLIETENAPDRFCGRVLDVWKNYNITKLIAGIEQFLDYARDSRLKEYWNTLGIADREADRLFSGMDLVDEGISLCQVGLIAGGMDVIRRLLREDPEDSADRSIYMNIIRRAIRADYGELLQGETLHIPELLRWSLRKGFYQQTLTMIEALIPGDMVERGIYYYAETPGDMDELLRVFNELYWTKETRRSRYIFADPEHYFIKNYLRDLAGRGRNREEVISIYADMRTAQVKGREEGVLPAYSQLGDAVLLREVLGGYYSACSARNQVNHATFRQPDPTERLEGRKNSRDALKTLLEGFIDCYSRACEQVDRVRTPLRLSPRDFARYLRNHKIQRTDRDAENGNQILQKL